MTEFLNSVRFQQQVWQAEAADFFVVLGTDISGGDQDGHARPGLQKLAREIYARHLRHGKIAHHDVKIMWPRPKSLQGLLGFSATRHFVPELRQDTRHE